MDNICQLQQSMARHQLRERARIHYPLLAEQVLAVLSLEHSGNLSFSDVRNIVIFSATKTLFQFDLG